MLSQRVISVYLLCALCWFQNKMLSIFIVPLLRKLLTVCNPALVATNQFVCLSLFSRQLLLVGFRKVLNKCFLFFTLSLSRYFLTIFLFLVHIDSWNLIKFRGGKLLVFYCTACLIKCSFKWWISRKGFFSSQCGPPFWWGQKSHPIQIRLANQFYW